MASTTGECDLDLSSCFIIRRKILSSNNRYFACRLRCYARHYKLQITENSLSESFDLAELECSGLHFVRFPFLQSAPKVICRTTSAISAKRTHTHKHSTIRFNSFSDFIDFLSSQNAAEMTSLFIRHSVWRYKGSTRTTWLLPLTALDFWNPNIIVPANSLILWRFPLRAIQTSTSVRSESYCIRQEAPFLSQSPS